MILSINFRDFITGITCRSFTKDEDLCTSFKTYIDYIFNVFNKKYAKDTRAKDQAALIEKLQVEAEKIAAEQIEAMKYAANIKEYEDLIQREYLYEQLETSGNSGY